MAEAIVDSQRKSLALGGWSESHSPRRDTSPGERRPKENVKPTPRSEKNKDTSRNDTERSRRETRNGRRSPQTRNDAGRDRSPRREDRARDSNRDQPKSTPAVKERRNEEKEDDRTGLYANDRRDSPPRERKLEETPRYQNFQREARVQDPYRDPAKAAVRETPKIIFTEEPEINREDSFEGAIRYPAHKSGARSPEIASSKQHFVTPDEVFGPISPGREYDGQYPPGDPRIVRFNSRRPLDRHLPSDELPLRSHSRYEPVSPYTQTHNQPLRKMTTTAPLGSVTLASNDELQTDESRRARSRSLNEVSGNNSLMPESQRSLTGISGYGSRKQARSPSLAGIQNENIDSSGILNTTTVSIERNNFIGHPVPKAEKNRRLLSQMSSLSKASSFDHRDYVDENLLLSANRLDSTLIRLFSDPNPEDKDYRMDNGNFGNMPYHVDYAQSDLISMDAVKWRVQPMAAHHKETLEVEQAYLEETILPGEVVKKLYGENILTLMDLNMLNRTEGQGHRAVTRLLVRTLQRRGHRAFEAFVTTLNTLGYTQAGDRLMHTQSVINAGISRDKQSDLDREKREFLHGFIHNPDLSSRYDPMYSRADTTHNNYNNNYNNNNTNYNPNDISHSREVQQSLDELKAELHALHDDVTAMKSSRRNTPVRSTPDEAPASTKKDPKDKAQKSSGCTLL